MVALLLFLRTCKLSLAVRRQSTCGQGLRQRPCWSGREGALGVAVAGRRMPRSREHPHLSAASGRFELIHHPGVAERPGANMLPKSRGPPGLTAVTGHTMNPDFFLFLFLKLCLKTSLHIIKIMFQVYSLMIFYFYFIERCNDHHKSVLELFCTLNKILHEQLHLILIPTSCLKK